MMLEECGQQDPSDSFLCSIFTMDPSRERWEGPLGVPEGVILYPVTILEKTSTSGLN